VFLAADNRRGMKLLSNLTSTRVAASPCHPDRGEAQWRDLRFSGSPLGMFFDRPQRKGGTCGLAEVAALQLRPSASQAFRKVTALPFVISTEAYPDFLLRSASDVHGCGFRQRKPHDVNQRNGSPQEIRGSAVQRSAVSPALSWKCFPNNAC
jgi:hypothetical protein